MRETVSHMRPELRLALGIQAAWFCAILAPEGCPMDASSPGAAALHVSGHGGATGRSPGNSRTYLSVWMVAEGRDEAI